MEKLQVNIVLEMLGRPAEHIKKSLNLLVEKIGADKGVKILSRNVHDPVPAQDSKDLYTTFAELSLELDSLENYFGIVFTYLPSHVELVYPENIEINNFDLNALANSITNRMHTYDAIAKKMLFEKNVLLKKLQEVAPHLFKQEAKRENAEVKEEPKKDMNEKKAGRKKKNTK